MILFVNIITCSFVMGIINRDEVRVKGGVKKNGGRGGPLISGGIMRVVQVKENLQYVYLCMSG